MISPTPPLRVLFQLLDAQPAGGQRVAAAIASELTARGHVVAVAVPRNGPAIDLFENASSATYLVKAASLRDAGSLPRLVDLARRHDVIYTHTSVPGEILGGTAAAIAGTACVIHRHTAPHLSPHGLTRAAQRASWRQVAQRATVICVSEGVARSVRALCPRRVRLQIVPNGAPDGLEATPSSRDGVLRIGVLGRLDPQKGMDTFVAAAATLRDAGNVELVLGVSGEDFPEFASAVRHEAITAGVRVVDPGSDGVGFLKRLDIVAMPSRWEGSPLTLFEAMALGKPIVATAIPGVQEVLAGIDGAILVPPGDAPRLAFALRALIADPSARAALGGKMSAASTSHRLSRTAAHAASIVETAARTRRS
jgi:glycosyltransferase involved in cell wall biosynthesis